MSVLLMVLLTFFGYILMYRLYGKYLARVIFKLTDDAVVPSKEFEDGIDYVPTKKEIIFGHHFTSIAGTGPIVGPAIAVIWGWVPALLWVFLGSIMMGAVHDFGALVISMRNKGKSISEFTARYINSRTRFFFFLIVFLALWIVIAIFGLVIAIIFNIFPSSVLPVWLQIPISIALGYVIYRRKGNIILWSVIAVLLLYGTMVLGSYFPIKMPTVAGIPPTGVWTIILLIYAFWASVLPVTTLLQPRDFINAYQLLIAMFLMTMGILAAAVSGRLELVAPAVQMHPAEAPSMWPFLFITIACGAISGFHSLVASGTSSKQVKSEPDALFVGYGSMLTEGALATLVIAAVAAGIGLGYHSGGKTLFGLEAWSTHYASWTAAAGLGSKIAAFVTGAANFLSSLGIPQSIAVVIMGVFVASFAGTTLDTATRIQRYIISELASNINLPVLTKRHPATAFAVISAGLLAFASGADGKGALTLWPMFGAVNQTLAALALIVITLYLRGRGGLKWMVSGLPALFMAGMTLWASILNQLNFVSAQKILLLSINGIIILLVLWIAVEGLIKFFSDNQKGVDVQIEH
ncbi:carbon starvation protein CstA [Caldithrix abyssi DSM 13497]|uniref:Carbon starvation protein n=1 Tax=Caldithrix abyssi DSM 13497 TaxID=880073 RepID=H1XS05_CALAY|nr:carbon starvation protein A [Caldithrix abyssi]APF18498.1 carbon starvation protein [Caldithrix abyssi DSM 13497]EHO42498.1 carbon starvation protein CstA [Caldithrix abyssi DSM 13497]